MKRLSSRWYAPLLRPGLAFREEPSQRLLVWTWILLFLSGVTLLVWVATGNDGWALLTLAFGFSGGTLSNLVVLRSSWRRRQQERTRSVEHGDS